jgi:hypothetical protein
MRRQLGIGGRRDFPRAIEERKCSEGFCADWGREAITFSGNGAEETRIFGIVFEGLAGFADSGVDAVVGINEDIFTPDGQEDFLSGDETVAVFGEQEEQLEGNAFEFDETAGAAQLEGARVELEDFKSYCFVGHVGHTLARHLILRVRRAKTKG